MGYLIEADNLSQAWFEATRYILTQSNAQCNNLLVEIADPLARCNQIELEYEHFCERQGIKHFSIPAKTVFPKKTYEILNHDRIKLYKKYPKLHKVLKGKWGSYFKQMINWRINNVEGFSVNQVEQLIQLLNTRKKVYKAAYTIQITNPQDHSTYTIGGPCLHYILLQLQKEGDVKVMDMLAVYRNKEGDVKVMDMLAVYRNHDFAVKAYGNYVGLGHLLEFLCRETGFTIGKLSCFSSHAYIENKYASRLKTII
ncbi:MAG TPA: hypothetical protein GXX36_06120 [Clostridiaceae bacterium]|nr:hypothetical protein [Clostridiaceae bacterium]